MLYAGWSIVLWLGVRLLRRGLSPWRASALLAAVGVACLVKATSYALLPGTVLVLGVALWRAPVSRRRRVAAICAGVGGIAVTLGAWVAFAQSAHRPIASQVTSIATGAGPGLNVRELASYLWQFYLPRLPFQQPSHLQTPTLPVYDVWLKQAWGAFGWQEVQFPGWLYAALVAATVGIVAVALSGLWRARRAVDWAVPAFLAVVVLSLLAGLHWTEYRFLSRRLGAFNSGRYLLPLAGVAGLTLAQALRRLRPPARAVAVAGVLGGLFVLDLYSLGLMLVRFYA